MRCDVATEIPRGRVYQGMLSWISIEIRSGHKDQVYQFLEVQIELLDWLCRLQAKLTAADPSGKAKRKPTPAGVEGEPPRGSSVKRAKVGEGDGGAEATPAQAETSNGVSGTVDKAGGGGESETGVLSCVVEDAQAGADGQLTSADPPDGGVLKLLEEA